MEKTPAEKLDQFFSQFKKINFKRREIILRPDEEPRGVFYLKKGYVRLYSLSSQGEELTLLIFKPQDLFSLMWAINRTLTPYYLEAHTPCELYRCPRETLLEFIKDNPDVLFELTSRILVRFGGLLTRMEDLVFGHAAAKVASILLICAQRFGLQKGKKIIIQVPLIHRDIANLVGVTRETASIELEKLEKKGIIGYQGKLLVIKNLNKLKKESLLADS